MANDNKPGIVWLNAFNDPVASLHGARSDCISSADLFMDGDVKIVIADQTKRIRVYKGETRKN